MKKQIAVFLVLVMVMSAAACSNRTPVEQTVKPETASQTQTVSQTQPAPQPVENNGPLKLAFEGKLENLKVGIGTRQVEVTEQLGEPIELAHFEGSSYLSYENMNFILDRVVESTKEEAQVIGISIFEGSELYGVKVGMTGEEIKKILGIPTQEYQDSEEEGGMWKMEYQCGDYSVTFYSNDKNSSTTAAYLKKL